MVGTPPGKNLISLSPEIQSSNKGLTESLGKNLIFREHCGILTRLMDDVSDHSPDDEFGVTVDRDWRVVRVLRNQQELSIVPHESLDRNLAVETGNDDIVVFGFDGSINYQMIARGDAGAHHRLPLDADDEGRDLVPDQPLVEVERAFAITMIISWRGEAGRHAA